MSDKEKLEAIRFLLISFIGNRHELEKEILKILDA